MSQFSYDPAQLERWNNRFSAEGYLFGDEPNMFLARQHNRLAPGSRALCVADGDGRNSVWLAKQGIHVTAFDFSSVGIGKARLRARQAGVHVDYHVCDIYSWDWSARQYDLIVAIFIQFSSSLERESIFAGMQSAVLRGGLLILEGYRPEQLRYGTGGPPDPDKLYTESELRRAFADLDILHLVSRDEVLAEGTSHCGMSAVIEMVARSRAA